LSADGTIRAAQSEIGARAPLSSSSEYQNLQPLSKVAFPADVLNEILASPRTVQDKLVDSCRELELDSKFVGRIADLVTTCFIPEDIGANSTLPLPPKTYPLSVAHMVAKLELAPQPNEQTAIIIAAMISPLLAHGGKPWETLKDGLKPDNFDTAQETLIDKAQIIAEDVARITRASRLFAEENNPKFKIVSGDWIKCVLSLEEPVAIVIKVCEAICRLEAVGKDKETLEQMANREKHNYINNGDLAGVKQKQPKLSSQERETHQILRIAELWGVVAEAIGWDDAREKISEMIFSYRQPMLRRKILTLTEKAFGDGIYDDKDTILGATNRFFSNIFRDTDVLAVETRMKGPGSIKNKLLRKIKIPIETILAFKDSNRTEVSAEQDDLIELIKRNLRDFIGVRIILKSNNRDKEQDQEHCLAVGRKFAASANHSFTRNPMDHIHTQTRSDYESLHYFLRLNKPIRRCEPPVMLHDLPVELQIRTRNMHQESELGPAAHYAYKKKLQIDESLTWLAGAARKALYKIGTGKEIQSRRLSTIYIYEPDGTPRAVSLPDGTRERNKIPLRDALAALASDLGSVPDYVKLNGIPKSTSGEETGKKSWVRNGDTLDGFKFQPIARETAPQQKAAILPETEQQKSPSRPQRKRRERSGIIKGPDFF
jgi:ppGpp synthetase/RelA/SpoT-type nucleotidyltranferase